MLHKTIAHFGFCSAHQLAQTGQSFPTLLATQPLSPAGHPVLAPDAPETPVAAVTSEPLGRGRQQGRHQLACQYV